MTQDSPSERRVRLQDLNWFGKSIYLGGTALRFTANLIDATTRRMSKIATESRIAFKRELDPNIEEAQIIGEYRSKETSGEQ